MVVNARQNAIKIFGSNISALISHPNKSRFNNH